MEFLSLIYFKKTLEVISLKNSILDNSNHIDEMDPLFLAYSCFRRKKYQECVDICSELLEKNPYDQVTKPKLGLKKIQCKL